MDTYMAEIKAVNVGGASPPYLGMFVVYDLPDRDCAAAASNGEYSITDNGVATYKAYIDAIVIVAKKYPTQRIVFVIGTLFSVSFFRSLLKFI
jgi:cellulose 1,4-beta-cellobiosidase